MASGMAYIAYSAFAVFGALFAAQSWYGNWGTGSAEISRETKAISDEGTESRVAVGISQITLVKTNDGVSLSVTQTADSNKTITNWGILDADEAGNMLFPASCNPTEVGSGNSITAVWKYRWK